MTRRVHSLPAAIRLAAHAHDGQVDRLGEPYILHPLRVMLRMTTDEERIVAVLHDALEDGPDAISLRILSELETGPVKTALLAITRRDGETYAEFIERVAVNDLARRVKLADLADNMAPERFDRLPEEDRERLGKRYIKARARLMEVERQG